MMQLKDQWMSRMTTASVSAMLLCGALFILNSCSGGINPSDYSQTASFEGTITFDQGAGKSNFPPSDSFRDLRVVAFHHQPTDTNLINALSTGEAIFSSALVDSTFDFRSTINYSMTLTQKQLATGPATYRYVVVAHQYGPNTFSDWKVSGVYCIDSLFSPNVLILSNGSKVEHVDIHVDFKHPPPQPFKR